MTKILNFALKIKGVGREGGTCEVLRPCHPIPQHLECAPTHLNNGISVFANEIGCNWILKKIYNTHWHSDRILRI